MSNNAEDSMLTAKDISLLDLSNTELAVLSANDTSIYDVPIGQGVLTLRQAFDIAGVKSLVMSLWKVPDNQSLELMTDFYQRILAGNPRDDSLRNAQPSIKKKYAHPIYWGAFIYRGDPMPLAHMALERYLYIAISEKLSLGSVVPVEVIIKTAPSSQSNQKIELYGSSFIRLQGSLYEKMIPINVIVDPGTFEAVDRYYDTLLVPVSDEDSKPVRFNIKCKQLGLQSIRFSFFRNGACIAQLSATTEIEDETVLDYSKKVSSIEMPQISQMQGNVLYIIQTNHAVEPEFSVMLISEKTRVVNLEGRIKLQSKEKLPPENHPIILQLYYYYYSLLLSEYYV